MGKSEGKKNPFSKFIIDEGEFVKVESGVRQLDIRELSEEEDKGDSSNNINNISKQ